MKRIVLDMDGVVVGTRRVSHLPNSLVWTVVLFSHWLFLFFPTRISYSFFQQYEIYIVSNRPRYCWWVTRLWFKIREFPVKNVHCIGLNGNKSVLVEKIDPDVVIDDRFSKVFGEKRKRL